MRTILLASVRLFVLTCTSSAWSYYFYQVRESQVLSWLLQRLPEKVNKTLVLWFSLLVFIIVVQPLSCLFVTLWTAVHQASQSSTVSQSLLRFISIELMMPSSISSSAALFFFAFNHFQDQGLFQWVGSFHQMAKVLELWLQHQSLQWIFRVDFL